ncbi:interleukin-18 receptor accessory protein-like isoform X2 [Sphaeramia orbicularis]|uniref:interleukin-18 receptor accessory protein-like isoform X2 n=1 Tax=Sphaeramia orbicularis TaxID=375764 RepID=UPI00117D987E|nr:interleukin-18 receptor accessory protein-like isoform X2 [Sphaeramia orbicularis]
MNTGYVLLFFIIPISLVGCYEKHHPKMSSGVQQNATHRHYRAVEGELFMMPCITSVHLNEAVAWSRTDDCEEVTVGKHNDLKLLRVETKHSGKYSCITGGFFHLQVVKKTSLRCSDPKENSVTFVVAQGGDIPCPGRNCSDNTNIDWYKGHKPVSEMGRHSKKKDGMLYLGSFRKNDNAVFFCDRKITDGGITWVFRRSVQVTVIRIIVDPPRITYPEDNKTEEVELGRNHTLTCEVYVPCERRTEAHVEWYINYNGSMVNMTQHEPIMESVYVELKVIRKVVIKDVTLLDLNHTYTCVATNKVGSDRATVKLKKKTKVKWQTLVEYAVGSLLLVAGLGFVLRVKWLELQLIYRSRWQYEKHDGADKEFDVFLSYVRSPPSAQMEGGSKPSSSSGPEHVKQICPSIMEPLKMENATRRPLEVLLPQVLEDQWGYRLCLLDRDVLPGGAFTNEVAHALQQSQMLICLLSADYLSDSNAVFVLESGVQALLHKWNLKVLLIWTNRDSTSLIQLDPPLPTLIQRALKVLPCLDWTLGRPPSTTGNFWKSLRKVMPSHKVQSVKG